MLSNETDHSLEKDKRPKDSDIITIIPTAVRYVLNRLEKCPR